MESSQRRCSAITRRGEQCRRRATPHSDPPLCGTHARRGAPGAGSAGDEASGPAGFYLPAFKPEELDHALRQKKLSLDDEISLARICLLRVAEALKANGKLTPEQRIRLAALVFRGVSTIARLLRDRHAVSDGAGHGLVAAILDRVVEEAADELGVEP